jgi:hypothetical protein
MHVGVEIGFEIVMRRHLVALAAFLVEADPPALALAVIVFFVSSPSSTEPFLTTCLGPRTAAADPIEQHADRREVLLDGRRAVAAKNFDVSRDVVRAHRRERRGRRRRKRRECSGCGCWR